MMLLQATGFAKFARSVGKEDVARKYDNISQIITRVIEAKKQAGMHDDGKRDEVYYALEAKISSL